MCSLMSSMHLLFNGHLRRLCTSRELLLFQGVPVYGNLLSAMLEIDPSCDVPHISSYNRGRRPYGSSARKRSGMVSQSSNGVHLAAIGGVLAWVLAYVSIKPGWRTVIQHVPLPAPASSAEPVVTTPHFSLHAIPLSAAPPCCAVVPVNCTGNGGGTSTGADAEVDEVLDFLSTVNSLRGGTRRLSGNHSRSASSMSKSGSNSSSACTAIVQSPVGSSVSSASLSGECDRAAEAADFMSSMTMYSRKRAKLV